jgi:hypothetical protein
MQGIRLLYSFGGGSEEDEDSNRSLPTTAGVNRLKNASPRQPTTKSRLTRFVVLEAFVPLEAFGRMSWGNVCDGLEQVIHGKAQLNHLRASDIRRMDLSLVGHQRLVA